MAQNKLALSIIVVVIFSVLLILTSCTNRAEQPEDLVASCNKLQNANLFGERDVCFNGLAYAKNDFKLCKEINTESLKSNCYYALALRNKDSSICASVTILRDVCYLDFARMTKDPAFCDKVEGDFYKNKCKEEAK